ncbi:MAG: hypothetical protein HY426_04440 [Candidatus Levybacteria bacterium]|nr:hypothetical protein [Candidatus Levybacteria bacterium]
MTDKVVQDLIDKTFRELSAPEKPKQRSRVWKHPQGYRYLVQWSNAVLLRYLIRLLTNSLPKSEYRRKAQLDDAGRSYLDFIGFSQGSLEEDKGDIRELTEDGFLRSQPGSGLGDIGINLGDFNTALKPGVKGDLEEHKGGLQERPGQKQNPDSDKLFLYRPLTTLYPPLAKVRAQDLTYEMFIELINKTDFLLRKLVESLERKLSTDQKYYQVERARIRDKFSR